MTHGSTFDPKLNLICSRDETSSNQITVYVYVHLYYIKKGSRHCLSPYILHHKIKWKTFKWSSLNDLPITLFHQFKPTTKVFSVLYVFRPSTDESNYVTPFLSLQFSYQKVRKLRVFRRLLGYTSDSVNVLEITF